MKKLLSVAALLLLILPASALGEDFLGVPLPADTSIVEKTKKRLEFQTDLSHDQLVEYYRTELEVYPHVKFRDWPTATYIEDHGKEPWHSVAIDKSGAPIKVVVMGDNWTWIFGTLLLRFIAVFVVLMVLFLAMNIAGKIIDAMVKGGEKKKAAA